MEPGGRVASAAGHLCEVSTMRVQMITRAAGPEFSAAPGDKVNVDAKLGKQLLAGGSAIEIEPDPKPTKTRPTRTRRGALKRGNDNGADEDNGAGQAGGNAG